MIKRAVGWSFFAFLSVQTAIAQESAVTGSPTPAAASPSPEPEASSTVSAVPKTPAARSIRISFLPPPLEGTISLGIYDERGGLVRILHQEAELDEFTVGEDALLTRWDGKNDTGVDLPAGKYRARGYLVGHLKVEDLGTLERSRVDLNAPAMVQIRLTPNPLANDERTTVSLSIGTDDESSFIQTADGLPLFTIGNEPRLTRAAITKNNDRSIDVWEDNGMTVEQFRVSNVDKMMAFDCGNFELK